MGKASSRYVQLKNPMTKLWVKVDKKEGRIVEHKKTPGPFKGVPIHPKYREHELKGKEHGT